MKITILTPSMASTDREMDLVNLTEYLTKKVFKNEWQGGGLLGGEYGYGVDFENGTFMMHQFCWCEKSSCDWCAVNGKRLQKKLLKKYGDKKWAEWGYAPLFWYKPSNFQVRWYKWIGRGTEYNKKISTKEWQKIYEECIKSLLVMGGW